MLNNFTVCSKSEPKLCFVCLFKDGFLKKEIIPGLTKVLPSPDVHVGVILAQVVEPALVHDEYPTSDDRSPAEYGGKESYFLHLL